MLLDFSLVAAGVVLLTVAADRLVVSAARLSRTWGLSPILIGAVVVGLGTSLPEMLVSALAAARPGGLDLAVSNVVGSNIANLALVLGVSVLLSPITGQLPVLRREGMAMLGGSVLLAVLVWNGELSVVEGWVLAGGLAAALVLLWSWARRSAAPEVSAEVDEMLGEDVRPGREAVIGVVTLLLTLAGARLLVVGAEGIAVDLGVPEAVIGFTLVAIGTSLPELATAVAAARRHENDLVLGNVLGSNLFNALGVAGVAGVIGGGTLTADFRVGLALMVGVSVVAGVLAATGDRLRRIEGAILLAAYPLLLLAAV